MPVLNYKSQTAQSVSLTYADIPAGAAVVFHNETSGADVPAHRGTLAAGSGSADIAIPGTHRALVCFVKQIQT
jgi:hypothetical protein